MASSLRKLTGVGGDVRKIAALLQKKAPPGHRLAYINDEEAALLKSHGGSGKPHADTGIQSFEPVDIGFGADQYQPADTTTPGEAYSTTPMDVFSQQYQDISAPFAAPAPVSTAGTTGEAAQLGSFPQPQAFDTARGTPAQLQAAGAKQLEQITGAPPAKEGMSEDTMKRLGLAGVVGLLGSRQAAKAGTAGQAGATEMRGLAAPYQQAGAQLQAQAQRGELTPQAQQSLQAVQAQAAQAAQTRGGVGAAQAQQQVEAFRQQLLAQQYDYGLKLSGIGDNIALGAIKTGLQADQYVNQLTNNYYTNIARTLFGSAPQAAATPATPGAQ